MIFWLKHSKKLRNNKLINGVRFRYQNKIWKQFLVQKTKLKIHPKINMNKFIKIKQILETK